MQKLVLIVTVLATAAPLYASEGDANNPFAGDIGNALWTLVIFGAVVLILGKFAWEPILTALKRREDFIRDALAQAKKDRDDAQAALQKHTEQLSAARDEASAIVDEGRRDAETVRRKIEDEARTESKAMVERARQEINLATDAAVKELYDVSGKLATEIASRIIKEEIDAAKHERLISESLEELAETVGGG